MLVETVVQDINSLIHPPPAPALIEKNPWPFWWHAPLGFVSIASAGVLLVAAGGLHRGVQQKRHGAQPQRTQMHHVHHKVKPQAPHPRRPR
jgi:hypothetical protein